MPTPSPQRIDFGNPLTGIGALKPEASVDVDAYGLAQGQVTYQADSSDTNLQSVIAYFCSNNVARDFPYNLGMSYQMKSYKYKLSMQKGGFCNVTVDFMGINRALGYTDPQLVGVVSTTSQPIETHPNFTVILDPSIGTANQPLAGKPNSSYALTTPNNPIFLPIASDVAGVNNSAVLRYEFRGFGVSTTDTPNKKAGVRQYLKPQRTIRGMIFTNPDSALPEQIAKNVGRRLRSQDLLLLVPSSVIATSANADKYLITSANIEPVGNGITGGANNTVAYKVTYDIQFTGQQTFGWDADIYGEFQS